MEKIEMKKTLVAVAALAAVAGAHAEATITGSLELGYANTTTKTAGATVSTKTLDDTNGNNVVNIGINEDIGNGINAYANVGLYPSLDYGTGATTYQTYLGLKGPFGSLQGGSYLSSAFNAILVGDAIGAWGNSPMIGIGMAANGDRTGWAGASLFDANQLTYTLPTMVSGVGASVTKKFGETTTGVGDSTAYSVTYSSGPLNVAYNSQTGKASTTATDKGTVLSANYNLGMATLYVGTATLKQGTNAALKGQQYGIAVPVDSLKFAIQYGTVSGGMATSTMTAGTIGQNQTDFLVAYTLSKRTSVNYVYSNKNNGAGASTSTYTTGNANTVNKVFVLHSF